MKTLFRRRVLQRLIWVCTVCLCPKNGTLGVYGLSSVSYLVVFLAVTLITFIMSYNILNVKIWTTFHPHYIFRHGTDVLIHVLNIRHFVVTPIHIVTGK